MLMLDLCSGLKGASAAMRERGWEVISVDIDPSLEPDVLADVREFHYRGPKPDLIWASPPCTEFSKADKPWPWCHLDHDPDLSIVEACRRIIAESHPRFWVLENVRGAQPWLGKARAHYGPFYLWGNIPFAIPCTLPPRKSRLSSRAKAERARIPYALSLSIALTCEGQKELL